MNCRSEELCKGVSKFLTSTTQRFWTGLDTSVRSFAHVDLLIRNIRGISLFQDSQGLVTHKRSEPNFNTYNFEGAFLISIFTKLKKRIKSFINKTETLPVYIHNLKIET